MVAGRRSGNITSRLTDVPKKTLNVLVISNQAVLGSEWEACLSARDYQVVHVCGVAGAVSLLPRLAIEVVVIDLASDPHDQSETLPSFTDNLGPEIPIILVADKNNSNTLASQLRDHAFGCLYRPVDAAALLSLIDAAIHHKRRMRESSWRLAELEAENRELKQLTQQFQDALTFTGYEWRAQITHLLVASNRLAAKAANALNTEQATAIERIRQSAAAMRRIARNYIDLAKLDDPSFALRPAVVNVARDIIKPLQFIYAETTEKRRQVCRIQMDSLEQPLIWADHDLLMSAYDNLFSNAIKYGKEEGYIIFGIADRGLENELSVMAAGPGIPPAHLERIFDRFAFAAQGPIEESDGIGLYLASKVIKAHGGRIWAENHRAGAWFKFVFTLPRQDR